MSEPFAGEPIDQAELTSRCCHRKPLKLQYQATYGDKTLYLCVDCGAGYLLKCTRVESARVPHGPVREPPQKTRF